MSYKAPPFDYSLGMKQIFSLIKFNALAGPLIALLLFATGCATNPVTGRSELSLMSEQEELKIGSTQYGFGQQSQGGAYVADPGVNAYVSEVGQKLAAVSDRTSLPYEFVVLNHSVPNAWALPGGKIAINRGLLTELGSEAELAAVLAHEITHAAAKHGARAQTRAILTQGTLLIGTAILMEGEGAAATQGALVGAQAVGGLVNLKYGRDAEREADHYGIKYMVKAGYDPQAAASLQEVFLKLHKGKTPGWMDGMLSSHPPSAERIENNRTTAATYPAGGKLGIEDYEQAMARLKKTKRAYKNYDDGIKALQKKNASGALALARSAMLIEPREALFHGLAARAYDAQEKTKDALREVNNAIALNPDYFEYYLLKGMFLEKQGDKKGAKEAYARSHQLLPTENTAKALRRLGK